MLPSSSEQPFPVLAQHSIPKLAEILGFLQESLLPQNQVRFPEKHNEHPPSKESHLSLNHWTNTKKKWDNLTYKQTQVRLSIFILSKTGFFRDKPWSRQLRANGINQENRFYSRRKKSVTSCEMHKGVSHYSLHQAQIFRYWWISLPEAFLFTSMRECKRTAWCKTSAQSQTHKTEI